MTYPSRYDLDPEALAWARAKAQAEIDRAEKFVADATAAGDGQSAEFWRRYALHLHRSFVGGEGCVMGRFDDRLPELYRSAAVSAVVEPPADQTAVREQLLAAIDSTCCQAFGYSTRPELLAAYDASRTPADQGALRDRIAEALYAHSHPGWAVRFADLDQEQRDTYLDRAEAALAVLPSAADWDALVREADRLRHEGTALHARTEKIGDQLAALQQQVTAPSNQAAAGGAPLSPVERTMLDYALDQAQERIWADDGFTDEDQAAVDSLRRLTAEQPAAGAPQDGAQQ